MELSKKDKRTAREIIDKGLQADYAKGLKQFDDILHEWKNKTLSNREAYMKLYSNVRKYDKHIARRYNYMTGSYYLYVLAGQLYDGLISPDDLQNFSDEIINSIKKLAEEE
jgi:hypothetical protein